MTLGDNTGQDLPAEQYVNTNTAASRQSLDPSGWVIRKNSIKKNLTLLRKGKGDKQQDRERQHDRLHQGDRERQGDHHLEHGRAVHTGGNTRNANPLDNSGSTNRVRMMVNAQGTK